MTRIRASRFVVLLIALGAALGSLLLTAAPGIRKLFEPLELMLLDLRVRAAARPLREKSEIVLVLFDSTAVRDWPYLSPFPRPVLADLIDVVAGGGARVIGLDVNLDRLYPQLEAFGNGDARLRSAIERAGNVVLGAETFEVGAGRRLAEPHPYFAGVAAGFGATDLPTPFETVRDAVLTVRTESGLVPGFALAVYARARGTDVDSLLAESARTGTVGVPGLPPVHARLKPRAAAQPIPVLFVGPPSRAGREDGAFLAISSSYAEFVPELFRDRVVLMGSGFHSEDAFRTPFYDQPDEEGNLFGWTYGVEVHANALQNLLSASYPIPFGGGALGMLLVGYALLVSMVTMWRGAIWGGAAAAVAIVGHSVGAFAAFNEAALHVPIIAPTLAIAFALTGSSAYVSLVEGKDKRMIRRAFGQYVAPAIVDRLVADPASLRLGGEKRHVSILFSDLAGFTTLSEKTDPERLLTFLNEYLNEMTNLVLEEGGTLDKYIGDAVMALFGAPTSQSDHALRACRTALRMQRRLVELNHAWAAQGWNQLHLRIGINSGTPVVGNIGGEKRFDYTALGDAVNLAARLEPACKSYEIGIMISEPTRAAAGDEIVAREIDLLAVYGRHEPMRVYELVAMAGDDLGEREELLRQFSAGLDAYRRRDFSRALDHFDRATALDPSDGPSRVYTERCRTYLETPPPEDWNLVERRDTK